MTESIEDLKRIKEQCRDDIGAALRYYEPLLLKIDSRVAIYAHDVIRTELDIHNLDELLCLRKFLRLLDTYDFDYDRVHQVIYDAEGEWADDWKTHIKGGLKIDGIYGYTHYRQTPMQVFVYAWIYGFRVWKDTTSTIGSRALLPSERENTTTGTIEDNRRLVTNFVMMWPRKVAKTFSGAFIQFEGLMRGERDYEGYIAANSADQSKLLFDQLTNMVTQMQGWQKYFKLTNSPQDRCIAWKRSTGRLASVRALTAGGKTKDGLKASCCSADEFGASQRIAGKIADMEGLINVIEGSMGPRREPLTVHTSTAGLGLETPYELKINALHDNLLKEMDYPLRTRYYEEGEIVNRKSVNRKSDDWQGAVILRPDAWERDDEEALRSERVIRKVNPNLGVTIQPDFYAKEWASADMEGDGKKKEVITKLYNIFATDRAIDWISADEIRALQVPTKITDCTADQGWIVLTGMDFTNVGNDLQASSYLAVRNVPGTQRREFLAFMDAWITTEAVMASSNKNLLLDWAEKGYLHIVPSKVLSPDMPVDRIVELRRKGVNMMGFGYDPYKANDPINKIKTWIASLGVKPADISNYVMPVGQKFGNMNPLVDEMTYMIRADEPLIHFEDTPMWSWEFNNCQVVESTDGMENKKIIKTRADNKVDNCQALLNALYVYDTMNGKVIRI